jgi:sulfite exporter TauE/SafE/copper chaperone CopZ
VAAVPPTIHVVGMTCVACERRIEKAVSRLPGVTAVRASHRTGRVRLEASNRVTLAQVRGAIKASGYEVGPNQGPLWSHDRLAWRDAAIGLGICVVGAAGLYLVGFDRIQGQLSSTALGGSLVLVVLLGVAASVSTCMALVGGLVLGVAGRYAQNHPGASVGRQMRPHLVFHLGRIVGFTLLGAGLGAVGAAIGEGGPGRVALAVLMLLVALVMLRLGVSMTEVAPGLVARFSPALPRGLTERWERLAGSQRAELPLAAGLGAASFFLPCGFTQAVQVYALASGSPVQSGAIMGLFALGTMPGLMAMAGVGATGHGPRGRHLVRALGVVVVVFGLVNGVGAVRSLAPDLGGQVQVDASQGVSANVTVEADRQVVKTTQGFNGYTPGSTVVYAGLPITWEIESTGISCASAIAAQQLGLDYFQLDPGTTMTQEIAPLDVGTYQYTCAMGMYRGSFTAIERTDQ